MSTLAKIWWQEYISGTVSDDVDIVWRNLCLELVQQVGLTQAQETMQYVISIGFIAEVIRQGNDKDDLKSDEEIYREWLESLKKEDPIKVKALLDEDYEFKHHLVCDNLGQNLGACSIHRDGINSH